MSCRCGKFDLDTAVVKPAPSKFQTTGYINETYGFYCGGCGRFHHVKQEEIDVVRGPSNAQVLLHASGNKAGQHILTWAIGPVDNPNRETVQTVEFFPWPRRFRMTETEPLIHLTWKLLMSKMDLIMEDIDNWSHADSERFKAQTEAKYQARGIAEVLAIQMTPFMESADHVVRCAVAAHKDPEFAVPGLGSHLWDPMKNPDGSDRTPVATPRAQRAAPAVKVKARPKVDNTSTVKLTQAEADGIKEAVGSGMFSKEDVASMFKVSMAEVESALSS